MKWRQQSQNLPLSLVVYFSLVHFVCAAAVDDETRATLGSRAQPACLLQVNRSKPGRLAHRQSHSQNMLIDRRLSAVKPDSKILVEIYYEFGCPHCKELLSQRLPIVWKDKDIRKSIDIKLYPLYVPMSCCPPGSGDYGCFKSGDGEAGCLGTRITLCAISALKDSSKYVPFVMCLAGYGKRKRPELAMDECSEKLGIDLKGVGECADSPKGLKMMESAARAAQGKTMSHVPWVVINGKHAAYDALLGPICKLLDKPRPDTCSTVEDRHSDKKESTGGCSKKKHGSPCFFSQELN